MSCPTSASSSSGRKEDHRPRCAQGQIESDTDSPRERADKWQRFAGLHDPRWSPIRRCRARACGSKASLPLIRENAAIQREIGFAQRSIETHPRAGKEEARGKLTVAAARGWKKLAKLYGDAKLSEDAEAIKDRGAFAERVLTLPGEAKEHDPGIFGKTWASTGSRLTRATSARTCGRSAREAASPSSWAPRRKAATSPGRCSSRATSCARTQAVRVHLADATPAKNSPLEFLSLLSFIDDQIWMRLGIADPEQYLTQYLKIETKLIQDTNLEPAERPLRRRVPEPRSVSRGAVPLWRVPHRQTQVGLKIPSRRWSAST